MRVWTVSLPALLTANYPWLSTTDWRPPLTGLASSLAICHAVKFLAPLNACAKMAILTTAVYWPIPPTKSVPVQRLLVSSGSSASRLLSGSVRCVCSYTYRIMLFITPENNLLIKTNEKILHLAVLY